MAIAYESVTVSKQTSNTTSHVMSMPGTRPSGDVYICCITAGSIATWTPPSGWTERANGELDTQTGRFAVWTKEGGGSEPSSYTWTSSVANKSVGAIIRISGAEEVPNVVSSLNAVSSSGDTIAPSATVTVDDTVVVRFGTRHINNANDLITGTPSTEIFFDDSDGTANGNVSAGASYENGPSSGNSTGTAAFTDAGGYSQWAGLTIAFEPTADSGVTGTSAQTLPSITQSASSSVTVTGASAQTLPAITQAVAATETFSAASAQTLPSTTQVLAAAETFSATAAQTLPPLTQSAAAGQTENVSGAVAQTLPSITQAAASFVTVAATSAQTLPSIGQDVSAELSYSSAAAQTLPAVTQSASAVSSTGVDGSVAQTLPSITQSAVGIETIAATAAQSLPSVTQSVTVTETFSGTLAQTLPALTQSASAVTGAAAGVIAQTLPAITQAAAGAETFSGAATQTLPIITQSISATASLDATGTIGQTLPSVAQSVVAISSVTEITGTTGQTLPSVTQNAAGTNTGSAEIPWYPGPAVVLPNQDFASIRQYLQSISAVANRANTGKVNVVINVTLDSGSATTTVTDNRLTQFSGVSFDPMTANAASEKAAGTMYVSPAGRRSGEWTITHANNAQTDRRFRMVVMG